MKQTFKNRFHFIALQALVQGCLIFTAQADLSAQQGLEKIRSNFNNSQENLKQYEANLKISEQNLTELKRFRQELQGEMIRVDQSLAENQKSRANLNISLQDFNGKLQKESQHLATEERQREELRKRLELLEGQITQRKNNLSVIQANITNLQRDLKSLDEHEAKIQARRQELIQLNQKTADDEKQWQQKRQGYQLEVKKWQDESDRQRKMLDSYSSLSRVRSD
jgi:chromosome segregation ATPase